ncbi:MAG: DMT family transporter, partial [Sedimenticola sp.]
MSDPTTNEVRTAWFLLFAAIVLWGANWPIMKIGLNYIGPLWFAAIRVVIATLCLFALLALQGRLSPPTREELPVVFSIGVLQIGIFLGLIQFSLLFVEAGRSAVLAYTTPIWTAPLALLFLRETLTRRKLLGIVFGLGGILILFNPFTFPWGWNDYTFGNALLIAAAMVLAIVIVHVRGYGWTRPHLSLLPWQFLLGSA